MSDGNVAVGIANDHELLDALRSAGYDLEGARAGDPPGASLVARREGEDRGILFTIDGAGRFRVEITWVVGEWPSRQAISGVPLRVVDSVTRAVNAAGEVRDARQAVEVVRHLDQLVAWASGDAGEPPPAD